MAIVEDATGISLTWTLPPNNTCEANASGPCPTVDGIAEPYSQMFLTLPPDPGNCSRLGRNFTNGILRIARYSEVGDFEGYAFESEYTDGTFVGVGLGLPAALPTSFIIEGSESGWYFILNCPSYHLDAGGRRVYDCTLQRDPLDFPQGGGDDEPIIRP